MEQFFEAIRNTLTIGAVAAAAYWCLNWFWQKWNQRPLVEVVTRRVWGVADDPHRIVMDVLVYNRAPTPLIVDRIEIIEPPDAHVRVDPTHPYGPMREWPVHKTIEPFPAFGPAFTREKIELQVINIPPEGGAITVRVIMRRSQRRVWWRQLLRMSQIIRTTSATIDKAK